MKLSMATTCMGRAHHLKQTLPQNLADNVDWSRPEAVEFIVLDYSSPDDLVEWITTDPQLAPYRDAGILKLASAPGQTKFRHSHAKNMAHALATGDYVCNIDSDNFTGYRFVDYLRGVFSRRPNAIVATHRFDPRLNSGIYKGSMGRIALSRTNFHLFHGWAGEDSDLVIRGVRAFLRPVWIRDRQYLRVVTHSDTERILNSAYADPDAELARIAALDGSTMRPLVRYVLNRVVAPRVANRGVPIGAGKVDFPH